MAVSEIVKGMIEKYRYKCFSYVAARLGITATNSSILKVGWEQTR